MGVGGEEGVEVEEILDEITRIIATERSKTKRSNEGTFSSRAFFFFTKANEREGREYVCGSKEKEREWKGEMVGEKLEVGFRK